MKAGYIIVLMMLAAFTSTCNASPLLYSTANYKNTVDLKIINMDDTDKYIFCTFDTKNQFPKETILGKSVNHVEYKDILIYESLWNRLHGTIQMFTKSGECAFIRFYAKFCWDINYEAKVDIYKDENLEDCGPWTTVKKDNGQISSKEIVHEGLKIKMVVDGDCLSCLPAKMSMEISIRKSDVKENMKKKAIAQEIQKNKL